MAKKIKAGRPSVAKDVKIIGVRFERRDVARIKSRWGNVADFIRTATLDKLAKTEVK